MVLCAVSIIIKQPMGSTGLLRPLSHGLLALSLAAIFHSVLCQKRPRNVELAKHQGAESIQGKRQAVSRHCRSTE